MSERGRERDRETHREKMRGSRGHMRALTKVSDGLMVIRFQCPTVARKEEAEFPILPSPTFLSWAVSVLGLGQREWEGLRIGWSSPGDSPWGGWPLSDVIVMRVMRLDTVGVRQGQKCEDFWK